MNSLFKYIVRLCILLLLTGKGAGVLAQFDPAPGCTSGYVVPGALTIDANTSPGTLQAKPENCLTVFYTIEWYSSTDGVNFNLVQTGGGNYTPGPISVTSYYYYKMIKSGQTTGTYSHNTCVVTVTTLGVGSIAAPVSAINYNLSPGVITGTDATGVQGTLSYQWESSYDNINWTDISGAVGRDYTPGNLIKTIYYRRRVTDATITRYTNVVTITVYPEFIIGNIGSSQVVHYGAAAPVLQLSGVTGGDGVYGYQWYSSTDGSTWNPISTATTYDPGTVTYGRYFKLTVTSFGITRTSNIVSISSAATLSAVPAPSVATGNEDIDLNWVIAKTFDDQGNVTEEHKTFYDLSGRLLQQQNKKRFRKDDNTVLTHVFATQPVQDAYGNNALNSMPAPIDRGDFAYKADFIQDAGNAPYSNKNYDKFNSGTVVTDKTNNPDPVGSQPGTLGWYYSTNNNWEPYTPTTSYPYLRSTAMHDGSLAPKAQTNAGDDLHMGMGHESVQYTMPATNELAHYIQVRNKFFAGTLVGATPSGLSNQAVQVVARDINGRETIAIQDKDGNTLMSGRPGNELTYSNSITVQASGVRYFYLSKPTAIAIQGINWQLYNMGGDESAVSFSSGNTLPAGYYKVSTGSSAVLLQYQGGFSDVGYLFYNQLGQVVASISPEGVKKLEGNGINNYTTKESIPFISLLYYDQSGKVIKKSSPNTGITQLVYCTDGKLRFTQNAEQAKNGRYTYTLYDGYGRPLEMGEYLPDPNGGIAFNADMQAAVNPMRDLRDNTGASGDLINGTKTDVTQSLYDIPDNTHGIAAYIQNTAFLGGQVSMTRKYSRVINNTPSAANLVSSNWYSYNGDGKMEWGIQFIQGLGYKTTDFYFDNLGRLNKKIFQKNVPAETFVHYYEFDAATNQIWKVYTNKEDVIGTRQLQATYYYYLHGPLKRVELAGNLQGLDYTYTLYGDLKAINNSDKSKDPGGDAVAANGVQEDAFGVTLDYYGNDYKNPRTSGVQPIKGVYDQVSLPGGDFSGNLRSMSWYSKKPAAVASQPATEYPSAYVYQYDDKYQFTKANWYNSSSAQGAYNSTNNNIEQVGDAANNIPAYDANGNINYLYRTDGNGTDKSKFTYQYTPNTDQLAAVLANNQPYLSYTYDATGLATGIVSTVAGGAKYIQYDVSGKVLAVSRNSTFTNLIVSYVYDEQGQRIVKKSYDPNGSLSQNTYYVDDVVYTQPISNNTAGLITAQEYEVKGLGGRIGVYFRPTDVYAYEMTDQQGNVRSVIARNGNSTEVRLYLDYYPYGLVLQQYNGNNYRHQYQGQYAEKENETNWNAFELRMYDSEIARWFSTDPKGQYSSPYMAMGNNPVNGVDKDGGFFIATIIGAAVGAIWEGASALAEHKSWSEVGKAAGRGAIKGAITGALFDAATTGGASLVLAGALSAMTAEMTDQALFGDGNFNSTKVLEAGLSGGLGTGLMKMVSSYVLRKATGKVINGFIEVPRIQSMGMGDEKPEGWMLKATEGERKQATSAGVIAVKAKLNLYPEVIDPRNGRLIKLPYADQRVPLELRTERGDFRYRFIKEWYDRGYPTPKGGWEPYDVHHIIPIEYGGTNDFWNLVPVERGTHKLFNDFWRLHGGL
jgi:RHS repeat-associated protein